LFSQKRQYGELLWIGNSKFQLPFMSVYYKRSGNYEIPHTIRHPFSKRSKLLCIISLSSQIPLSAKDNLMLPWEFTQLHTHLSSAVIRNCMKQLVWRRHIHGCLLFLEEVWIRWGTVEGGRIADEPAPGRRCWRGQDEWY